MKTNTVTVKTLLSKVKRAAKVIPTSTLIPILENVLFDNGNITGSDLRNFLIVKDSGLAGTFLAPAKQLIKILSVLDKNSEIEVVSDPETYKITLKVVGSSKTFSLSGENTIDFPKVPVCEIENGYLSEVDIKSITQALPYVSKDDLRPSMCAVYMNGDITSTDGHRLIWNKTDGKIEVPMLIPSESAKILVELGNSEIFLSKDNKNIRFEGKTETLVCQDKDERFPDYRNAIPTNNPVKMMVGTETLIQSVKLALLAANQTTKQVEFRVSVSELKIVAADMDFNQEYTDIIDVETQGFTGTFCIGVNGGFLLYYLQKSENDVTTFEMSAPNRAMILDGNFLLMPVMLRSEIENKVNPHHNFQLTETVTA